MFCGIIFVPLVLRTSCLFSSKCTFQGLTSQRPKLKHTYHKGVQHMHSSWKLHCDMKDIQTLHVISKMSKAWPFRRPTRGKHPHPAKLQASESWKSDHKASNSHWFEDVCNCENWAQHWIGGGQLPGGCEPVQEPLWPGTQCNPGSCRAQGWGNSPLLSPSSSSLWFSGSGVRVWWFPTVWRFCLVVCRLRRTGHAQGKELFV